MHQVSTQKHETAAALASSLFDYLLHTFLPVSAKGECEAEHIQAPVYNKWQRFMIHYESILSLHNGELLFYLNIYRCSQHYPSAINNVDVCR